MIKTKIRPSVPSTLESTKVIRLKESLSQKAQDGEVILSEDFTSYWTADDVKEKLWTMHRGKCCYCERKRDMKRESDVEHFRPKAEVTDDQTHKGYWWLAYDWDNYLLSCKTCNQTYKKNWFPLIDENQRAKGPEDDIDNEQPFFINPAEEDPEDYISFEWGTAFGIFVKAVGTDNEGRGARSTMQLGLNEGTLPEQRAEIVKNLMNLARDMYDAKEENAEHKIKEYGKLIKENTSADNEFAGFRRKFFRGLGLSEYISGD